MSLSFIEIKEEKISFAFNETIQGHVSDHITTHKKQSGGAGQYARVVVDVKPLPRGEYFKFEDKIVGGVIPKTYIPSVEKGCKESMQKGPLGFPVTDIQVTLKDGKTHDVDSNSNSFHIAGIKAQRETLPDCKRGCVRQKGALKTLGVLPLKREPLSEAISRKNF